MKMEVACSYETVATSDHSARRGSKEDNIDMDIDIDIFVNCSWVDTRWQ